MKCALLVVFSVIVVLASLCFETTEADYGHHGHHQSGHGTACIVKGSYCNCHYCKCEKGWVHCKGHGYGKKELECTLSNNRFT